MVSIKDIEGQWTVEEDEKGYLVVPPDRERFMTIRVTDKGPAAPAYAQLLANLLNSGVNDDVWKTGFVNFGHGGPKSWDPSKRARSAALPS